MPALRGVDVGDQEVVPGLAREFLPVLGAEIRRVRRHRLARGIHLEVQRGQRALALIRDRDLRRLEERHRPEAVVRVAACPLHLHGDGIDLRPPAEAAREEIAQGD